jgi:hypothetical protein
MSADEALWLHLDGVEPEDITSLSDDAWDEAKDNPIKVSRWMEVICK